MNVQLVRALTLGIATLFGPALAAQEAGDGGVETTLSAGLTDDAVSLWQSEPNRIFDASEVNLEDFHWIARPVVVFGESPDDPNFVRQMEFLASRPEDLAERDILLIVDTDPSADGMIREMLRPRGFMLAILGKDGQVKLRKPLPWSLRELTRSIDKMPIRQQEINAARGF